MKKGIILLFSILSFSVFSQENAWVNVEELDGVTIEESVIKCGNNELLTFRISNANPYSITISWFEEVWINDICKQTGNSEEHFRVLSLKSGEEIKGNCSFQDSFYIGSKIKRGNKTMVLTHFDLKNISVIIEK